jgi:hypothetical protein
VSYVHFMCESHQVVRTEGLWSETFYPGTQALKALDPAARAEILALFPELATTPHADQSAAQRAYGALARPDMTRREMRAGGAIAA